MGPQPFGCGRGSTAAIGASGWMLQWGRNLSVAEGADKPKRTRKGRKLQWGRNLSVAEGRPHIAPLAPALCFNGAATFRLRKVSRTRRPALPASGFNGAATFRLRKGPAPSILE